MAKKEFLSSLQAQSLRAGNHMLSPQGGELIGSASQTGAITVALPAGVNTCMVSCWIDVFVYSTGKSFSVYVCGYTYSTPAWVNASAKQVGSDTQHTVRFTRTAAGQFLVQIGESTSTWAYPNVLVRDVRLGHAVPNANWENDWMVSIAPVEAVVDATVSTQYHPSDWSLVANKPTTFTPSTHTHAQSDITGLPTALGAKLDASSYTAADVLSKLTGVDGTGSGLDADLLDGQHASAFVDLTSTQTITGTKTFSSIIADSISTKKMEIDRWVARSKWLISDTCVVDSVDFANRTITFVEPHPFTDLHMLTVQKGSVAAGGTVTQVGATVCVSPTADAKKVVWYGDARSPSPAGMANVGRGDTMVLIGHHATGRPATRRDCFILAERGNDFSSLKLLRAAEGNPDTVKDNPAYVEAGFLDLDDFGQQYVKPRIKAAYGQCLYGQGMLLTSAPGNNAVPPELVVRGTSLLTSEWDSRSPYMHVRGMGWSVGSPAGYYRIGTVLEDPNAVSNINAAYDSNMSYALDVRGVGKVNWLALGQDYPGGDPQSGGFVVGSGFATNHYLPSNAPSGTMIVFIRRGYNMTIYPPAGDTLDSKGWGGSRTSFTLATNGEVCTVYYARTQRAWHMVFSA